MLRFQDGISRSCLRSGEMSESILDVILSAAEDSSQQFNTEMVRKAWYGWCEKRRAALRTARAALEEASAAALVSDRLSEEDPLCYSSIHQLWTDHLILETSSDVFYRVPYSVNSPGSLPENVQFGTPSRVMETFVAASRELDLELIHLSADRLEEVWPSLFAFVALSRPSTALLAGPPVSERKKLAKSGKALGDGSYPIPNVAYLKKAIQALGRAADYDKALNFIKKRARELGVPNLVAHLKPKGQKNASAQAGSSK